MRHKNTKSLKNLKQFQNKVRFTFYVRFRPIAQKLFFPIVGLVLMAGIVHYERSKEYVFENPKVAVVFEESSAEGAALSKSVGDDRYGTLAKPQTQTLVSSTSTETSPVRATSEIEAIRGVADKEGIDWKILGAIFIKETQGDCHREGDTEFIKPSWGCYQINKHYHPEVSWEQATDIKWSSQWTAKRLKAKAEKYGWDNAIAMHNGNPKNPAVQAYLKDVKRIMGTL